MNLFDCCQHGVLAVTGDDLEKPLLAGTARGKLSTKVAHDAVRVTHIIAQEAENAGVRLAGVNKLDRTEPHTLLVHLCRVAVPASGITTADIDPVSARDGEPQELAVNEDRPDYVYVVEVASRHVGIIGEVYVAGRKPILADVALQDPH